MFFGTKEIVKTAENPESGRVNVTLKDAKGNESEISVHAETLKVFSTEEALTGSELQEKVAVEISKHFLKELCSENDPQESAANLVGILYGLDVRLVDVDTAWAFAHSRLVSVKASLDATIEAKNAETIVGFVGKEKLDAYAGVF